MIKTIVSSPENAAIYLGDVKRQLRIEPTYSAFDDLLNGYIASATAYIENICGRKLISQSWKIETKPLMTNPIYVPLPFARAQSITSVTWKDEDGEISIIDPSNYELIHINDVSSVIRFMEDYFFNVIGYHSNPLSVIFITGFGDNPEDIPSDINLALKLIISHYYDNNRSGKI